MKECTGYCIACEDEIINDQDHYKENPSCNEWVKLVSNDPSANCIQNTFLKAQIQLKDTGTTCANCNVVYSNIGNLNKHYKKHPECLKLNLYKNIYQNEKTTQKRVLYHKKVSTLDIDNFTELQYYRYWPDSMYNKDLDSVRTISEHYLRKSRLGPSNGSLIVTLDDTLLFSDSMGLLGHKHMDLVKDIHGNPIFILPVNIEIKKIIETAKKLGIYVVIITSRPEISRAASLCNLKLFGIVYDEFVVTNDKQKTFEKINSEHKIIMDIGRVPPDTLCGVSPISIIIPHEKTKYTSIYSNYKLSDDIKYPHRTVITDKLVEL